jgi:hypothetical protein
MRDAVYTDRKDPTIDRAIRSCFPSYNSRTVQIQAAEKLTLRNTYWDGGTRSTYSLCYLSTGEQRPLPQFDPPQFGGPRRPPEIELREGFAVLEHVIFCGKDLGIHFHVHPATLAPLLPDKPDLSLEEQVVLNMTCALTSAGRKNERERQGFPDAAWERGKASLIEKGFLRKNGAVTNEGRTAAGSLPSQNTGTVCREWRKTNGIESHWDRY